jgi:hypothetical protein
MGIVPNENPPNKNPMCSGAGDIALRCCGIIRAGSGLWIWKQNPGKVDVIANATWVSLRG